ncbi:MAG: LPXTG cell wall anchor domain-containing protein [Firmicutes bacterium]|nr:LPXTG cell wall anchor domain-containing protein [Bacillota bacterium]
MKHGNLPFTAAGLLLLCGAALILMRRCRREN